MRAATSLRTAVLWLVLNRGSVSGFIVYSTASLASEERIASPTGADRHPHRGPGEPEAAIDVRSQVGLAHPPGAVGLRPVGQLVAHVRQRDDVVGDDLRDPLSTAIEPIFAAREG
jgi:hypothetical protein